jgi:hypothetical protein
MAHATSSATGPDAGPSEPAKRPPLADKRHLENDGEECAGERHRRRKRGRVAWSGGRVEHAAEVEVPDDELAEEGEEHGAEDDEDGVE